MENYDPNLVSNSAVDNNIICVNVNDHNPVPN